MRVLLVDDDEVVLSLNAAALGAAGHEVWCTSDAPAARKAIAEGPDAVVLDLSLPGGEDGLDVLRAVRADAETAGLPVLVLSARSNPADRAKAEIAGADAFLPKPYNVRELVAVLDGLIATGRRQR